MTKPTPTENCNYASGNRVPVPIEQIGTVVHVIGSLVAGGAERFVIDLVRGIKALGYDVRVLVLSSKMDEAGKSMAANLDNAGIPYLSGPTKRIRWRSVAWYINSILLWKPDIVHLHTANTDMAHVLARVVFRKRHQLYRTIHNLKKPPSLAAKYAICANKAALSIACSEAAFRQAKSYIKGNMITIRNGKRFSWPIRTSQLGEQFKVKLGLEETGIVHFLAVGRMGGDPIENAPKGYDTLLKAWNVGQLRKRGARLHMLGDGALREKLEIMAEGDSTVRFYGVRSDVTDWMIACDCFVMPSRSEGLPIAGIEAIGTGLPCVFSDIEPLRELQPSVAVWHKVDDVDQLAENLLEMIDNYRCPTETKTLEFRNQFSDEHTVKQYDKAYRSAFRME